MNEEQEWCDNSRRWIIWMAAFNQWGTCPYNIANSGCKGPGCGYYRMKPASRRFKKKERAIKEAFG